MTTFTAEELTYLDSQTLGRLATVREDGSPQGNPVGFTCNRTDGTIEIAGYAMATSQKFERGVEPAGVRSNSRSPARKP